MIISHRHKFIFVHNYKVAGTSVRKALKPFGNKSFFSSSNSDKLKFLKGDYPKIYAKQFEHHVKATELKRRIPADIFDSYFKFGFVRNPWDQQVSLYKFMLKRKTHHQHKLISSMRDFDEYIEWRVNNDVHLQKEFFYDGDNCLMDFIGKMENLGEDFSYICDKVGIESKLTHLNASRSVSDKFISYYSQKTLDMVYEAYKEDIELFGYSKPELKKLEV